MTEDFYFLDEGNVKISAASVGISRQRWSCIKENEISNGKYIDIMKSNRFDQLPIISNNGSVNEYFKTTNPNDFTLVEKLKITYDDIIPLDTNIKDVIDKFVNIERNFYFLSFYRNISGLITLGNLNCKQVQIFLFSLVCELERELGYFLNTNKSNIEIENWMISNIKSGNPDDKFLLILNNYKNLIKFDLENQLTEHLYLVDFFEIISDLELYKILNFSKTKWNSYSSINELRKRVAHPTRNIIDKGNSIFDLKNKLNKIDDLLFRLKQWKNNNIKNIYMH